MSSTDNEASAHRAVLDWIKEDAPIGIKMQMTPDLANKLSARIAHRRASQAAPAPVGFGIYGEYTPITVVTGTTVKTPAPSDHLVSVGKASGMVEARVSLAARQIRQTLRDYGHRCAETSLPDLIAADVDAALRKQDELHAPAPSDGLREAAATILAVLEDPDSLPIEKHPDWQAIYNAMTADHNESVEISGDSWHDWPSILIAGLEVMAQDSAALTSAPAQEGEGM